MRDLRHVIPWLILVGTALAPRPAAATYPSAVRCDHLQLSPAAAAYQPGEPIAVQLGGSAAGAALSTIAAYYAAVGADLTQTASWTAINGSFAAGTGTFSGSFAAPATPGVYLVVGNIVAAGGETCGGNPGFACCPGGITVGAGLTTADAKPCLGCQQYFIVAPAPAAPVSCGGLTISPQKDVYGPNETLQIAVQGAASDGSVAGIEVFFAKADGNLQAADAWHALPGTFDAGQGRWTGTIDTTTHLMQVADPRSGGFAMRAGELFVVANVTSSSGKICSGNPRYAPVACPDGIAMGGGIDLSQQVPCDGCALRIAVDPLVGAATPIDGQAYWNLAPGNYWHYSGENREFAPAEPFAARVEIEAPTLVCGIPTLPMRYLKSNIYGYWGPQRPAPDPWQGIRNLRFFSTGFLPYYRWSSAHLGTLGHKTYKTAFSFGTTGGAPAWYGLGTYYAASDPDVRSWDHLLYTAPFEHLHFPPYLLGAGPASDGWYLHRQDALFGRGHDEAGYCAVPTLTEYAGTMGSHGWKVEYALLTRSFPSAGIGSGPALRVKYVEYGVPYCGSWVLREDYYLVKNVGLVQIDVKRMDCSDPDLSADAIAAPQVTMSATAYFDGQPMVLGASKTTAAPGETITIALPHNYTGRVERELQTTTQGGTQSTATDTWQDRWIASGTTTLQVPTTAGLASLRLRLRPPVPANPSAHEHVMAPTSAPWSQPLVIAVAAPPGPDAGPPPPDSAPPAPDSATPAPDSATPAPDSATSADGPAADAAVTADGPAPDAATPDGAPAVDGPVADRGSTHDAGSSGDGAAIADARGDETDETLAGGGCDCRVGAERDSDAALTLCALALALLCGRRRRRGA